MNLATESHPLLVKLTGYRLLVIVMTLAFGVPKAVLGLQGLNVAATSLDLGFGIIVTLA